MRACVHMWMRVCVPVCCLCLSVSVCLCLCLSVSVCVCLCLSLSVSVCLCLSVSLSLCLSVWLYVCMHACMYIYIYYILYIYCIYIYILYIYILYILHTSIHSLWPWPLKLACSMAFFPLGRRSQRIWRTKTILAVRRLTVRQVSRQPETWQKRPGDAVSEGIYAMI